MMNMRSNHRRNVRAHALSNDGGVPWTNPADAPGLVEPDCQPSIIRHEPGLRVFSNPAGKTHTLLTVRTSADGGATSRSARRPVGLFQPRPDRSEDRRMFLRKRCKASL